MPKLEGKIALITGASRGIGRAIARAFAREGADLTMVARTPEPLRVAAEEMEGLGAGVLTCAIDVTDSPKVDEAFAATLERFGGLDLLVNNAGIFDGGPLDELSLETWNKVIATNLTAPLVCTRAAMRIMKRRGGGRIINIGSISGSRVRPNHAPYNAAKHGLWGLTQSTALEGREHDITCCCLNPGNVLVERRIGSGRAQDEEPMMTPDELAEVALTIAALPPHVEVLEATVIPHHQLYVGRG
jgi:NAD(P)-dependent dehydrogenase (short-subunit alcohol dehydrogenase family)